MKFTSLRTCDFRNLTALDTECNASTLVLTGPNGQGKTNVLETLYILSYGSSFRTSYLKECISWGKEGFFISGDFIDEDTNDEGKISLSYFNGQRKIMLDDKEIRDRKELVYRFPCIVFCHDDISFVKGEPEERRKFFDQMLSLYSPSYFDALRTYKAILAQSNAAVSTYDDSLISLYNERLAKLGMEIMEERTAAVHEFNRIFPSLFSEISGTDLTLSVVYQPSWKDAGSVEEIIKELEDTVERDKKMNTTTSGIHRDRFVVMSQYGPFAQIGSTGQLRLCSLIFRIAEAIHFSTKTNRKPMLLLDDVLLELDSEKRGKVLSSLPPSSQTWCTFLPDENYNEKGENSINFSVRNGGLYV